jgi:hypothetical protein
MTWLDQREQQNKRKEDENKNFREILATALEVFDRISRTRTLFGKSYELDGKHFKSVIANSNESSSHRSGNSKVYESIQRIIEIEHSEHGNRIILTKDTITSVDYYHYDEDDDDKIPMSRYNILSTVFDGTLSDAQLKSITYDEWVTISGWLANEVSLEEALKSIDKEGKYSQFLKTNNPLSVIDRQPRSSSISTGGIIGIILGTVVGFVIFFVLGLVVEIGSLFTGQTDAEISRLKLGGFVVFVLGGAFLGYMGLKDT